MIQLQHEPDHAVALFHAGRLLCRYVYVPEGPPTDAPRPYFHPLNSLAGDTLTNFRPNDHPWHHGLSLTLNSVSGINFWGGPTQVRGVGYQWLSNHGSQHHLAWTRLESAAGHAVLAHTLEWRAAGEVLLREERSIDIEVQPPAQSWSLHWRSRLVNASSRDLSLGNPHSTGGLPGSHYTGLQFRGARELLDDHLDPKIKLVAEGGVEGVAAVHGLNARWMEWHGQLDTTLTRIIIRFENNPGPLHWFVRHNAPLAAFPPQFDEDLVLAAGGELQLDHTLTFTAA